MALEDDIMTAIEQTIRASKEVTSFVGTVQNATPVQVLADGTSIGIPCLTFVGVTLAVGNRVVVNKYGTQFVVMGVLST